MTKILLPLVWTVRAVRYVLERPAILVGMVALLLLVAVVILIVRAVRSR